MPEPNMATNAETSTLPYSEVCELRKALSQGTKLIITSLTNLTSTPVYICNNFLIFNAVIFFKSTLHACSKYSLAIPPSYFVIIKDNQSTTKRILSHDRHTLTFYS